MSRARRAGLGGMTVVEVVVALVITSIVAAAALGIMLRHQRLLSQQLEIAGTHDSLRTVVELLAGELRSASPSAGDLYAVAPDSIALRSTTGFGSICGARDDRLVLRRIWGAFGDGRADSVLVFREGRRDRAADDEWVGAAVRAISGGGSVGCPDGRLADVTLELSQSLDSVEVGSPVRSFRPYVYRLYRSGSDWWLGQRLRGGPIQPVAGPLLPPLQDGLRLEYLARGRRVTRAPSEVVQVIIRVRARSSGRVYRRGGAAYVVDSLSTVVFLRNS